MGKTFRRSVIRTWIGEGTKLGMYVRYFLSENADDIKMAVKKQNMDPMCVAKFMDKNW